MGGWWRWLLQSCVFIRVGSLIQDHGTGGKSKMDIPENARWGMAFIGSPLLILVILLTIPKSWLKWVGPLLIIMPVSLYFIFNADCSPCVILETVLLAVLVYGISLLLVALVNTLRGQKKAGISGEKKNND